MSIVNPDLPVIITQDEPATMSPAVRFLRTLLQTVIALAAITAPAAALAGLSATTAAKVTGLMGAAVLIVSALHNGINQAQAKKNDARDAGQSPLMLLIYVVVAIILIVLLFKLIDRV